MSSTCNTNSSSSTSSSESSIFVAVVNLLNGHTVSHNRILLQNWVRGNISEAKEILQSLQELEIQKINELTAIQTRIGYCRRSIEDNTNLSNKLDSVKNSNITKLMDELEINNLENTEREEEITLGFGKKLHDPKLMDNKTKPNSDSDLKGHVFTGVHIPEEQIELGRGKKFYFDNKANYIKDSEEEEEEAVAAEDKHELIETGKNSICVNHHSSNCINDIKEVNNKKGEIKSLENVNDDNTIKQQVKRADDCLIEYNELSRRIRNFTDDYKHATHQEIKELYFEIDKFIAEYGANDLSKYKLDRIINKLNQVKDIGINKRDMLAKDFIPPISIRLNNKDNNSKDIKQVKT